MVWYPGKFINFGSYWNEKSIFPGLVLLVIWVLAWKGLALWQAAKKEDKVWFVVFLVFHTLGLAEIIYLLMTSESDKTSRKSSKVKKAVRHTSKKKIDNQ